MTHECIRMKLWQQRHGRACQCFEKYFLLMEPAIVRNAVTQVS